MVTVRILLIAMTLAVAAGCSCAAVSSESSLADATGDVNLLAIERVTQLRVMQCFPDGAFHPGESVSEADFARTLDRLLVACPSMGETSFEKTGAKAVSRVRAVAAIMRGMAASDASAAERRDDPEASSANVRKVLAQFSDWKSIPEWAAKYVAYGLDKGYVEQDPEFRPNDTITRSELAAVMARCLPPVPKMGVVAGVTADMSTMNASGASLGSANEAFTGLVIDCRGLGMDRCMSPQVMTEGGERVYPDPRHLPSLDYMEEVGIASYVNDLSNARRAGDNPLQIKAVRVEGPAHQIAVVSDADGESVLSAEKKGHFLRKYQVTFLLDK